MQGMSPTPRYEVKWVGAQIPSAITIGGPLIRNIILTERKTVYGSHGSVGGPGVMAT